MTDIEWDSFWTALQTTGKWAETWHPSEQDETDWELDLRNADPELLDECRRRHNQEHGRYRQPDVGKFLSLLGALTAKKYGARKSSVRVTVYWVCCTKDDRGFGRIGNMIPFSYPVSKLKYLEDNTGMSNYLARIYAGRWMSMQMPFRQVRDKIAELKHEAGICNESTCLLCNPERAEAIGQIESLEDLQAFLGAKHIQLKGKRVETPQAATKQTVLQQKKELIEALPEREKAEHDPNKLFRDNPYGPLPF